MKSFYNSLLFFISLLLVSSLVYCADPNSPADDWQFKLMPYTWLPTVLKADKATLSGVDGSLRLNAVGVRHDVACRPNIVSSSFTASSGHKESMRNSIALASQSAFEQSILGDRWKKEKPLFKYC